MADFEPRVRQFDGLKFTGRGSTRRDDRYRYYTRYFDAPLIRAEALLPDEGVVMLPGEDPPAVLVDAAVRPPGKDEKSATVILTFRRPLTTDWED